MCQGWTLCMYSPYQERTYNQEQTYTRCLLLVLASDSDSSSWKTQDLTIKLWGGGSLSLPLALKVFLESFYSWMKVSSWSKPDTFQSALHMLSADHWNIDGPPFPVKCVRKFRSALGGEVAYRCVYVCMYRMYNVWKLGVMKIWYNLLLNKLNVWKYGWSVGCVRVDEWTQMVPT